VGVDINDPANVHAWATTAVGGGIWGHGGVASDGANMFVVTGNTFNTGGNWMGGEAIIRLQAGPNWTGQPTDYWAPHNWLSLDTTDTDLGGVSATVLDVSGATPSELVLALGKDGNAYLVDRNNLGGINGPVYQADVIGINRGTSAVTYHTRLGTYIAFHNDAGSIRAYKITAASPPTIVFAWSQSQAGRGSPWVTTTDGINNAIVWVTGTGTGGDQRLHGYDGDIGSLIYAGGGANELMTGTRQWNTGIAAHGHIYFGADNKVYAFTPATGRPTPTATPTPTSSPTATARQTPTPRPRPTPRRLMGSARVSRVGFGVAPKQSSERVATDSGLSEQEKSAMARSPSPGRVRYPRARPLSNRDEVVGLTRYVHSCKRPIDKSTSHNTASTTARLGDSSHTGSVFAAFPVNNAA
jgi:hypothetical protein